MTDPWTVDELRGVWAGKVIRSGNKGIAFVAVGAEEQASLLAAAPDLLTACNLLYDRLLGAVMGTSEDESDREAQDQAALDAADLAIEKAEGVV